MGLAQPWKCNRWHLTARRDQLGTHEVFTQWAVYSLFTSAQEKGRMEALCVCVCGRNVASWGMFNVVGERME